MLTRISNINRFNIFSQFTTESDWDHDSDANKPIARKTLDLPQEIIDNILDHLAQTAHSDTVARSALRECLFVSRRFHRRAQQNLLLDISVSQNVWTARRLKRLVGVLQRERFLFLHLRSLKLQIYDDAETTAKHEWMWEIVDMVANADVSGSECAGLKHLAVGFYEGGSGRLPLYILYTDIKFKIISILTNSQLTSLVLVNMFDIPIHLILSCSCLERLELVDCDFDVDAWAIGEAPDPPLFYRTLKYLRISEEGDDFFSEIPAIARRESPVYSTLQSLVWEFTNAADVALLRLQLDCSPLLEELTLTHRTNDLLPPDIASRIQLSRRQNLRSLTLNIITTTPTDTLADIQDCKMLTEFAVESDTDDTPGLEVITINVTTYCNWPDIEEFMENHRTGWRDLDECLAKEDLYPCLREVNLRFHILQRPGKARTLVSQAELEMEFSVLYRFSNLKRRKGVVLNTSITRGL